MVIWFLNDDSFELLDINHSEAQSHLDLGYIVYL